MKRVETAAKPAETVARFLGADGAHDALFRELALDVIEDHLKWRARYSPSPRKPKGFVPSSPPLERALQDLMGRLRGSAPFHSPYYIAHMASDVLIPATLGYLAGLLYNQNNIAREKSPSTTPLELEVAAQLAHLVGYNPRRAWGHLTSGGTIANFEGLWAARNLKAFPFAARSLATRRGLAFKVRLPDKTLEDIRRLSPVELLNLPVPEVMRMRARLEEHVGRRAVSETLAAIGPAGEGLASLGDQGVTSIGAVLLPGTKHYSWLKIAEALGVGRASLRFVELDDKMRMKPKALIERVRACRDKGEAVLAVIAVVGSTAEGAVDPVDRVVQIQASESPKGSPFYIHADAAYGGYVRSALISPQGKLQQPGQARAAMAKMGAAGFPGLAVARALAALGECDSVTIDPHKFGYAPVPAGAVLFKEGEIRGVLATPRPYFNRGVEDWRENPPSSIGGFILEGTKPGAAAASCWLAHQVVPLNQSGYGQLVASAVRAAGELAAAVEGLDGASFTVGRSARRVRAHLLTRPDLNIMCFGVKVAGEHSLANTNALNRAIFREFAIEEADGIPGRFILSSTTLTREEYGTAPLSFLRSMGISSGQWEEAGELFLLRAVVLSPEFAASGLAEKFKQALRSSTAKALGAR